MNIIKILFPSQSNDIGSLKRCLMWSGRVFYVYSFLIFLLIGHTMSFLMSLNPYWIIALFMVDAAILFYIFQAYRRFFSLSGNIAKKTSLRIFFFCWIVIFLLFNILQIVITPLSASGTSIPFQWVLTLIPIALSVSGELLFRKI